MDLGVADHVYVVTGGARGLGRATAEVLVAEGARVVLSGRSQESLDAAVATLGVLCGRGGRGQRRPRDTGSAWSTRPGRSGAASTER